MTSRVWVVLGALVLVSTAFLLGRATSRSAILASGDEATPGAAGYRDVDGPDGSAATRPFPRGDATRAALLPRRDVATSVATTGLPLPPANVPLKDIVPELERRARGGDARASCRLGFEMLRCRRRAASRANEAFQTEFLARMRDDTPEQKKHLEQQIRAAARAREAGARDDAICAGIEPAATDLMFDWFLHAAERGNPTARLQFLQQIPVDPDRMASEAERLRVYRDVAPRLASSAIAEGDPRVLRLLAFAHFAAPPDTPRWQVLPSGLRHLLPADNERALAYWILAERYAPTPYDAPLAARRAQVVPGYTAPGDRFRAALGPEGIAAAEALAAEIERTHFSSTTPRPATASHQASPDDC